jgi:small nuclear ribonucleoprotein (snRNP)-like protein
MMVPPHHMRPALGMPPPPAPQPPSFLPGAASLFEQPDRLVLVVLREVAKHLVGALHSYDQLSNSVHEDTHERHFVGGTFYWQPAERYWSVQPAVSGKSLRDRFTVHSSRFLLRKATVR